MSPHVLIDLLDAIIAVVLGGSLALVVGSIVRPSRAGPNMWMAWVLSGLGILWYFVVFKHGGSS